MRLALRTLLVLGLPTALAGQTPRDTVELNPVVVTATRIPTPAAALPVAVTVISAEQMRGQGIRTVADALRTVPAANVVTTSAYGSQTSLFLRGGESDYVKVLIDGVPQNAPGGAYDFANLTTDDIERIEVVRGPASVLYGSDAVTGVVQIFTRDGHGRAHGSVKVSGGTYNSSALDATVAGGDERAGYSVGVSRFSSDGVYSFNNQYRNEVVSGRLRFHPDGRDDAALSLRYGDALYHFPTDGAGAVVSNNQHQLDRGPSLGLDLGHTFSDLVEGRITADWHRDNQQYAIGKNGPADTTTFPFSSSDWVTRTGLEARLNLRPASAVVTVGGSFERETMNGTTLDTSRSRNDGAAYVQVVTAPEQPLSLTLGGRLEDNQRFGTYATYRGGLSVRIAEGARGILSVGTGFKEPGFYETFATGFVRGNPNLKPEHSLSWELGLEYTVPAKTVTGRATYFDQRFRDLIQYSPTPLGPDSVNYGNVAGAIARGLEVGVQGVLPQGLSFEASYTYVDSRDLATGQRLQRRPTQSGSLRFGHAIGGRGTVSLVAVFTGDRDDYNYAAGTPDTLPSHARVDLSSVYDLSHARGALPGVTLTARIENVFGTRYEDVTNFPARGRTLLVGGRLNWGL